MKEKTKIGNDQFAVDNLPVFGVKNGRTIDNEDPGVNSDDEEDKEVEVEAKTKPIIFSIFSLKNITIVFQIR